jgi:hypothetical protein
LTTIEPIVAINLALVIYSFSNSKAIAIVFTITLILLLRLRVYYWSFSYSLFADFKLQVRHIRISYSTCFNDLNYSGTATDWKWERFKNHCGCFKEDSLGLYNWEETSIEDFQEDCFQYLLNQVKSMALPHEVSKYGNEALNPVCLSFNLNPSLSPQILCYILASNWQ